MQNIQVLAIQEFAPVLDARVCEDITTALESGRVILMPELPFSLRPEETQFLTPASASGRSKNISYDLRTQKLRGDAYQGREHQLLKGMLHRFAAQSRDLVQQLFPLYRGEIQQARTSYRPVQVTNRPGLSYRKDDQRLHVDAFPATPNQGRRILRVFSNIHPEGVSRVWRVGDQFENVARHFLPKLRKPSPFKKYWLQALKMTKGSRTDYDAYMLQLHDFMKADEDYQKQVIQETVHLPAGSSWIVFTDQVSHAAMSGQYCLEQTFYLPVEAMQQPELSPFKILENILRSI